MLAGYVCSGGSYVTGAPTKVILDTVTVFLLKSHLSAVSYSLPCPSPSRDQHVNRDSTHENHLPGLWYAL